jgi:hypothetical protein
VATYRQVIHSGGRIEYRAGTDDAPAPRAQGGRRYAMRRTILLIAAVIGALLTIVALAGGADAATAVEYGLIAAL